MHALKSAFLSSHSNTRATRIRRVYFKDDFNLFVRSISKLIVYECEMYTFDLLTSKQPQNPLTKSKSNVQFYLHKLALAHKGHC